MSLRPLPCNRSEKACTHTIKPHHKCGVPTRKLTQHPRSLCLRSIASTLCANAALHCRQVNTFVHLWLNPQKSPTPTVSSTPARVGAAHRHLHATDSLCELVEILRRVEVARQRITNNPNSEVHPLVSSHNPLAWRVVLLTQAPHISGPC